MLVLMLQQVFNNGFVIGFGRVAVNGTSAFITVPITLKQHCSLVVSQYNGGTAGFHTVQGYFENISRIQVRNSPSGTPAIAFMYIGS